MHRCQHQQNLNTQHTEQNTVKHNQNLVAYSA